MNKTAKGIVIGLVIGLVISSGIALAANSSTLYNVITSGVRVVIDGKELNATDGNGKHVEPLIYNGTTYLPVRAIANALGKAVYWDGENYTVYLGNMDGKLQYPTLRMDQATDIGSDKLRLSESLTDNYGNTYSYAYHCWYSAKSEFLLNSKYSRVKGTVYIPKGIDNERSSVLTISCDDKIIFTSPEMTKTSRPIDFDLSIKGCNDFKINTNGSMSVHVGNVGFYQ